MATTLVQTIKTNERAESESISRSHVFILGLLMLTVIVLSFTVFTKQSLRLDEAQSLWQTSHSPLAMLQIVAEDVHVPLYHFMLHYWQVFFGNSVATARFLSLIFFVASIPSFYVLGSFVYNRTIGLFCSVLLAISPFINWYGNEIRMYSLFVLLTIWNMYFFLRIFVGKNDEAADTAAGSIADRGVPKIWLGYAITVILGMFTHYFFAFNLITQAIFFLTFRRYFPLNAFRRFVYTAIILAICYTPWVIYVLHLGAASNTQPQLAAPTTIDVFNTFSQFLFGFQDDHINTILVSLWPILVLLIFLSLRHNYRVQPPTTYLFFALFLPIFMAFVISNAVKPIYLSRYLVLTLPALYLLVSWILYAYPPRLSTVMRTLVIVGMASMLTVEIVNANTPVKENYRAAADYLSTYAKPQDVIVLSAPFTIYPFQYYYNGPDEIETLPLWDHLQYGAIPAFDEKKLPSEVDQIRDNHQVLWLLLSYDQGYEEKIRLYFDTHYERLTMVNFSPGLNLYAYRLRYDSNFTPSFPLNESTSTESTNFNWQSTLQAPIKAIEQGIKKI